MVTLSTIEYEHVILVGHGSRDQEGVDEFVGFARDFAAANGRPAQPAFLEFAQQPVLDAIDEAVAGGARSVYLLPLFLGAAGHQKTDVPAAIQISRAKYPGIALHYGAPLGPDARLLDVLGRRIAAAEAGAPLRPRGETALLLVGRGSGDPDSNSDVAKMARLLWEGRGLKTAEIAFAGITAPTVQEGVDRCAALGAKRIIVLPYFLFTGVLVKRIRKDAEGRAALVGLEVVHAGHIGSDALVHEVLSERLEEAVQGRVAMSCDVCIYRRPIEGFENKVGLPQVSDRHHGLRTGEGQREGHDHDHGHGHDQHAGHDHDH